MSRRKPGRVPLPKFGVKGVLGDKGSTRVRVWLEAGRVIVAWSEPGGGRKRKSYADVEDPNGRELAAAFAKGTYARLEKLAAGEPVVPKLPRLSVRGLWKAYTAVEFEHLAPKSQLNYRDHWDAFELHVGKDFPAADVTLEHIAQFRKALRLKGHVAEQIRRILATVRLVYRWGALHDKVPPSKVLAYRFKRSKLDRSIEVGEYTPEQARKILAEFDPRHPRYWRPYVAAHVLALTGPRANAALHLEWRDVDFRAGTITWRAELDKMSQHRVQPMPPSVAEALWVAYGWRCAYGYAGPLVFFRPGATAVELDRRKPNGFVRKKKAARLAERAAARAGQAERPYTYQAFTVALHKAETRAGITPTPYKASHAFRRGVVGSLRRATGDLVAAGKFIGDKDVRVLARSYDKTRPEELRYLAELAERALFGDDATAPAEPASDANRNPNANGDRTRAGRRQEPHE